MESLFKFVLTLLNSVMKKELPAKPIKKELSVLKPQVFESKPVLVKIETRQEMHKGELFIIKKCKIEMGINKLLHCLDDPKELLKLPAPKNIPINKN